MRAQAAQKKLDAYAGRPVADLALKLGPPTTQFAMGGGRQAFQWYHTGTGQTPGIVAPIGNSMIVRAPQAYETECRVSVVAHPAVARPSNLGDWIVDTSTFGGNGCV